MPGWTIKALWIGSSLSKIEQLSLASFVYHGHKTELFAYEDIQGVPSGVTLRDANQILPEAKIFKYKSRPSYACFANWFRYEMLYREGGIWVDTDVVCLKPFDMQFELLAGWEQLGKINNAVIGANAGDPLFEFLSAQCKEPNTPLPYDNRRDRRRKFLRRYFQGNQQGNLKWGETGPIGLTKAMQHFKRLEQVLPVTAFYPIHPTCWNTIFDTTYPSVDRYFPDSYAIHLWNEMIRRTPGYGKDKTYPTNSLIEVLKQKYLSAA